MAKPILLAVLLLLGQAAATYHCCSAGEPQFLGTYKEDGEQDGAPKFTNSNGMTVFRNNGFWCAGARRAARASRARAHRWRTRDVR